MTVRSYQYFRDNFAILNVNKYLLYFMCARQHKPIYLENISNNKSL